MKVLLVGPHSSIHLQKLAEALTHRGHTVGVATQHVDSKTKNLTSVFELKFKGAAGYFLNARALKEVIASFKPAVINAHYASGYGMLASLACPGQYILSYWGDDIYDFPQKSFVHKAIMKRVTAQAKAVASTSMAMKAEIETVLGAVGPIWYTPFGVDVELFQPGPVRPMGGSPFVIGTVRGLEPVYGIDILLTQFKALLEAGLAAKVFASREDIRLRVVGDGPQRAFLVDLAKRLGISDCVDFLGKIQNREVARELHQMDVFVAPSRRESFGVAVLEAMACEKPVIVSKVGGLPEIVDDRKDGFIFDIRDPDHFVSLCLELIKDRNKAQEMGRRGREKVKAQFSLVSAVERFEQMYSEVSKMDEGPRARC